MEMTLKLFDDQWGDTAALHLIAIADQQGGGETASQKVRKIASKAVADPRLLVP